MNQYPKMAPRKKTHDGDCTIYGKGVGSGVVGKECWGEWADTGNRWSTALQSGSREGTELERIWGKLKGEAVESSELLGREVDEVFQVGSVTGGTMGKIVESSRGTNLPG